MINFFSAYYTKLLSVSKLVTGTVLIFTFSSLANGQELAVMDQLSNLGGGLGIPAMSVTTDANGSQNYSVTIQILAIMTALTLLPALLMMMTSGTTIMMVSITTITMMILIMTIMIMIMYNADDDDDDMMMMMMLTMMIMIMLTMMMT